MTSKPYALLAVGELLVDLIGHELTDNLRQTRDFHRYQGGSPANLAANMARLGNQTALVACVGSDNLGTYLKDRVEEAGVDTQFIAQDDATPTSVVIVSRTQGTPDFIAYRQADCQLQPQHLPDHLLQQSAFFHTTCFALSRPPAQNTILDAARRAHQAGCQVCLDANYAPSIWPDRAEAQRVVQDYCAASAWIKLSEDDAARLFGEVQPPEEIVARFHAMGASLVCLTLGADGSFVSFDHGAQTARVPGKKINVIDATGAGDAYWAGFLTACLDGKSPADCARAGAALAEKKLTRQGPLPTGLKREEIYG